MRVCIIAVLIIGLYIGAEAQRGGRGGNGRGGRPGGRVGGGKKWNKGPRKGLGELCDTDLDELECEDGQWPRLFKGSACEDISDGDQFPNWKELENPCTDANVGGIASSTSCYVCGEKSSDRSSWKQRWTVSGVENGINLDFTFPCKIIPDLKNLTCTAPE